MQMPKITQRILDAFVGTHFIGQSGVDTQLIEWNQCSPDGDSEPQWTQTAVDFARLVAQENTKFLEVNGEQRRVVDVDVMVDIGHMQKRIAELEAELNKAKYECGHLEAQLNDVNAQLTKDACYLCNFLERGDCHVQKEELRAEINRMRPVVEAIHKANARFTTGTVRELRDALLDYEAKKP